MGLTLAAVAIQWRSGQPFGEGSILDWTDGVLLFSVAATITSLNVLGARWGECRGCLGAGCRRCLEPSGSSWRWI